MDRTHARAAITALAAVGATALVGCGQFSGFGASTDAGPTVPGFEPVTPEQRAGMPKRIAMGAVGDGAERVYVMRRAGAADPQRLIIFFHGYGTDTVASEEPWLTHLAREATVAWPVYNEPPFDGSRGSERIFPAAVTGLREALGRLRAEGLVRTDDLVVAGYSLGGALARDYAAAAPDRGLPRPRALYAVFPGRGLCDQPPRLPPQPGEIGASTRILALASRNDLLAGACGARKVVRGADRVKPSRKRLRLIRRFAVGDHFAPTRSGLKERETFWAPLDRVLAEVEAPSAASRASENQDDNETS